MLKSVSDSSRRRLQFFVDVDPERSEKHLMKSVSDSFRRRFNLAVAADPERSDQRVLEPVSDSFQPGQHLSRRCGCVVKLILAMCH